MKKLMSLILIISLLSGCATKKVTTVCEYKEEGYNATSELVSKGDEILTELITEEVTFQAAQVDQNDQTAKDEYRANLEAYVDYGDIDTITSKVEETTTGYTLMMNFNYAETDVDQLKESGIMSSGDYVSLKKALEFYNTEGYSCLTK